MIDENGIEWLVEDADGWYDEEINDLLDNG